ncbi:hypothetical protein KKH14_03200 [Patescibacteria group bacterium]|nr:hypothetical protein [Patescibacteria group bacterium]
MYSYPSYYNYYSGVAYAGAIANIPTGPENALPLILAGGLILSVIIYLIVFKIRFGKKLTLTAAYNSAVLERRLKKIRERELNPDLNVIQS